MREREPYFSIADGPLVIPEGLRDSVARAVRAWERRRGLPSADAGTSYEDINKARRSGRHSELVVENNRKRKDRSKSRLVAAVKGLDTFTAHDLVGPFPSVATARAALSKGLERGVVELVLRGHPGRPPTPSVFRLAHIKR